jgi:hypothetical protein
MSRPDEGDDGRTVEVEYIQRVKGSLNRLLNASLSDDGKAVLENRGRPFPLMYNSPSSPESTDRQRTPSSGPTRARGLRPLDTLDFRISSRSSRAQMPRPTPKYRPDFTPHWKPSPDLAQWPPVPFREVYPVGNRAGANWQTVASNWSVDVADLIWFNFGTSDPRRINWYLHYYVGCHKSNDGKNFSFRQADPGLIYIPPRNWRRPWTVPLMNTHVAWILAPLVGHFPRTVSLSGLHITRGDFVAVVQAIRTGQINVMLKPTLPHPAEYVPSLVAAFAPANTLVLKSLPVSDPLTRIFLVHEAVHAISDMKGQDIFIWQTEFFAYATSALVSLSRDPAFFTPDSWSASAFKAGFGLANKIKAGAPGILVVRLEDYDHIVEEVDPVLKSKVTYNPFLRLKEAIKHEKPYIGGWWKRMPADGI